MSAVYWQPLTRLNAVKKIPARGAPYPGAPGGELPPVVTRCATATLQQDIDKLHHSGLIHGRWSSMPKTVTLRPFSRKRERPSLQYYKLGDVQLSVVESFTYLGVTISSDRGREHVHSRPISAKGTRLLNFVRCNIDHCIHLTLKP